MIRLLLWCCTAGACVIASLLLLDSIIGQKNAIQQCAETATALGVVAVPYVFTRAIEEILSTGLAGRVGAIGAAVVSALILLFISISVGRIAYDWLSAPPSGTRCPLTTDQRAVVDSLSTLDRKVFYRATCSAQTALAQSLSPLSPAERNSRFNELFDQAGSSAFSK